MVPACFGDPPGCFPTWRKEDGGVSAGMPFFFPMMARQTYAYAAAFHLTGDERTLEMARIGVDFLLRHVVNKSGGFHLFLEKDAGGKTFRRGGDPTAADASYVLLAPAFLYYLTNEDSLLDFIVAGMEHVFRHYCSEGPLLNWLPGRPDLVMMGCMDQINCYLALTCRRLPPGPVRQMFETNIRRVVDELRAHYYSPEHDLFWGTIHPSPGSKQLGGPYSDFGHTIKAFWMMYVAGQVLGDDDLVKWGFGGMVRNLERAFLPEQGTWAGRLDSTGCKDPQHDWWQICEINQAAATVALKDARFRPMLARAYQYWFDTFVDREHGEVFRTARDGKAVSRTKAFRHKSGFHSMEHCLVSYIASHAFRREPVALWFALRNLPADAVLHPYHFTGKAAHPDPGQAPSQSGVAKFLFSDVC
jgi:mannose/cellobiose epimerase-like protein (N-acyl-D-glucosamine 2-epimerase family)